MLPVKQRRIQAGRNVFFKDSPQMILASKCSYREQEKPDQANRQEQFSPRHDNLDAERCVVCI